MYLHVVFPVIVIPDHYNYEKYRSGSIVFSFVLFLRERERECHCCVLLNSVQFCWKHIGSRYEIFSFLFSFGDLLFMQSLDMKTK